MICAAGSNHDEVGSPVNDPDSLAVCSTAKFLFWKYLSWFSNRGRKIEVAAPGGGLCSTVLLDPNRTGTTGFGKLSGTSMAAPYLVGEAALIWATQPEWKALQVHQTLRTSVDYKGSEERNLRRIHLEIALAL